MHRPLLLALILTMLAATSLAPAMSMRGSIQYVPQPRASNAETPTVLLVKVELDSANNTLQIKAMNTGNKTVEITRIDLAVSGIDGILITPVPGEAMAVEIVGGREYTRHARGTPILLPGKTISYSISLPGELALKRGAEYSVGIHLSDGTLIEYYGTIK